jgi:hypothetical protein
LFGRAKRPPASHRGIRVGKMSFGCLSLRLEI